MTTKVKSSRTSSKSAVKSVKVGANDVAQVLNVAAAVAAPAGSGLSDGSNLSTSAPVGVGSSSASSRRAARMDARTKLENSLRFEGFKLSVGVREFSQKLGVFFSAKEWTGEKADTVRASLDSMFASGAINEEQRENIS